MLDNASLSFDATKVTVSDQREFIRHPTDIPVHISALTSELAQRFDSRNVSQGGVALNVRQNFKSGTVVRLTIDSVSPPFSATGRVAWSLPGEGQWLIGIEFLDDGDLFRARMVEQVCHIEHYKRRILETEGRELSGDVAAMEWIDRFASEFPKLPQNS